MMKLILTYILLLFFFSCKTTVPATTTNNSTSSPGNTTAIDKDMQDKGIDLTAVGSIPVNWHLEMNFDDTVRFSADDGLELRFAFHKLAKSVAAGRNTYTSQINGGDLSIIIEEKDCTVPTVRQSFSKAVTVTYRTKTYTGCGKFVANEALNGKWMLEKIGTTAILPEEYNKIPVLQFDLAGKRVTGNDGCNTIGGNIEVQGNRIQFSSMFSTKMACMKKSIEKIIASSISDKLVNWYFRNEKLYLYLEDDSLLIFKKA